MFYISRVDVDVIGHEGYGRIQAHRSEQLDASGSQQSSQVLPEQDVDHQRFDYSHHVPDYYHGGLYTCFTFEYIIHRAV